MLPKEGVIVNLPNKLTIFRIFLIPVIMIVCSISNWRVNSFIFPNLSVANFVVLLLIFIGALTDFLDGHIARKYNLVTNLGKFLDPLADKLLTCTGFIILLQQNAINQATMAVANALPLPAAMKGTSSLLEWWMVIIILAREFMVTGIRLLAAGQGKVIAANKFGKVKTTLQFITILFLLAGGAVTLNGDGVNELQLWFVIVGKVLLVATLAITIFSGYEYLVKNLDIFKDIKDKKEKKLK